MYCSVLSLSKIAIEIKRILITFSLTITHKSTCKMAQKEITSVEEQK